ncbi:MAG TPA: hypothetical protein VIL81_00300 [Candidatus Limnocylindrales bacterium]
MVKTDWELITEEDGTQVLTRYETPIWLWLLDRWFRFPDFIFDRVEWWFPRTSRITRIPCTLYSRWSPQLIMRRDWTEYDVTQRPEPDYDDDDADVGTPGDTRNLT